eukprot:6183176-Pleurochrysis_carterae.AAC.4
MNETVESLATREELKTFQETLDERLTRHERHLELLEIGRKTSEQIATDLPKLKTDMAQKMREQEQHAAFELSKATQACAAQLILLPKSRDSSFGLLKNHGSSARICLCRSYTICEHHSKQWLGTSRLLRNPPATGIEGKDAGCRGRLAVSGASDGVAQACPGSRRSDAQGRDAAAAGHGQQVPASTHLRIQDAFRSGWETHRAGAVETTYVLSRGIAR